jgi:integrase
MQPWPRQRTGLYRRRAPQAIPRAIPDGLFNDLFAKMDSDRDRALLAMFVSAGPRAAELLGLVRGRVNVGDQLIGVIRKGTRALQWLPASPDAFVWLRLYQHQMRETVPAGANAPVWWTLRRPFRLLTYPPAGRCCGAPTRCWAPTGRCTTCDTPRARGWRRTRPCR